MSETKKDYSKYFQNTDLGITLSRWITEDKKFELCFLPMQFDDSEQHAIQTMDGKTSTVTYKLFVDDNGLIFCDIGTKYENGFKPFRLDTSELNSGKLHLGEGVGRITLTRQKFEAKNLFQ